MITQESGAESETLPDRLGLIAGGGRFPFLVLERARSKGVQVTTLAIEGEAEPSLEEIASEFHWMKLGQLSRCVKLLRNAKTEKAVMAGRVRHVKAFDLLRPDPLMIKVLAGLRSRRTDAILARIATVFMDAGVELIDSTCLMREDMASEGCMGRHRPRLQQRSDIDFGLRCAFELARQDIGQCVVVREGTVVAVEAMEGTNDAIRRAGSLVSGKLVIAKTARPEQDLRFDVPVVGPRTIEIMAECEARVLALEAGRVLLLDKDLVIERADRAGIVIFGSDLCPEKGG